LATLSKSRRERIRQLDRRCFTTGRAVLHEVKNAVELARCFTLLIDLHQRRRESLGQRGCFRSAAFTAFHRDLCEQMLEDGRLRMLWMEIEGRTAAVEYGIVGGDTVYYYQGGFDPDLADERPGWLSFSGSLHQAIDEGYRKFDFLRGDEQYKASWHAEPQPLVQVRVVGRRAAARARNVAWRTGECLRGWARQKLGRGEAWTRLVVGGDGHLASLQPAEEAVGT
jgi:CelD/BcsL family acetyltransferase involved in cellulose biosynthesis